MPGTFLDPALLIVVLLLFKIFNNSQVPVGTPRDFMQKLLCSFEAVPVHKR